MIAVSDRCAAGEAEDASGPAVAGRLRELPCDVGAVRIVPDDAEVIVAAVRPLLGDVALVVLTGGTGLGPRDVTPQAVLPLLDYEVPGMAEAMRAAGLASTPHAMLSRQVVGVARGTLVLALPGSARAARECLDAIWPALPHALQLLRGDTAH